MALVVANEDGVDRGPERDPCLSLLFFTDAVLPIQRNDCDVFWLGSSCLMCVAGPWSGIAKVEARPGVPDRSVEIPVEPRHGFVVFEDEPDRSEKMVDREFDEVVKVAARCGGTGRADRSCPWGKAVAFSRPPPDRLSVLVAGVAIRVDADGVSVPGAVRGVQTSGDRFTVWLPEQFE